MQVRRWRVGGGHRIMLLGLGWFLPHELLIDASFTRLPSARAICIICIALLSNICFDTGRISLKLAQPKLSCPDFLRVNFSITVEDMTSTHPNQRPRRRNSGKKRNIVSVFVSDAALVESEVIPDITTNLLTI
jgi:hypothetical protein